MKLLPVSFVALLFLAMASAACGSSGSDEEVSSTATAIATICPATWHCGIVATMFWVGEPASEDNGYIDNLSSAWTDDWVEQFGCVDDPDQRGKDDTRFYPVGCIPSENPFYCALPLGDYIETGVKEGLENVIPWYEPFVDGESLLKNRWIEVQANGMSAYCQWEDVGPIGEDDAVYVFGFGAPQEEVGLDLSPAMQTALGLSGYDEVSWRFVEESEVPLDPWKRVVTISPPIW